MKFCQMYALHFLRLIIRTLVINMMKSGLDEECEEKRYIFEQNLNIFRANKDAESRMAVTWTRSDYKKTIRTAR